MWVWVLAGLSYIGESKGIISPQEKDHLLYLAGLVPDDRTQEQQALIEKNYRSPLFQGNNKPQTRAQDMVENRVVTAESFEEAHDFVNGLLLVAYGTMPEIFSSCEYCSRSPKPEHLSNGKPVQLEMFRFRRGKTWEPFETLK